MKQYIESLRMDLAMLPEDVYFTNWKNYSMEYHMHSVGGIEINYVTSGECDYYIEGKRISLTKRNLLILNSSLPHKLVFTSKEPCLILGMACGEHPMQPGYVSIQNLMDAYDEVNVFFNQLEDYILIKDGHTIFQIMEDIWAEERGQKNYAYMQMECNKLLIHLARYISNRGSQAAKYVSRAKEFMTYHYFEIHSIEEIASDIGISKVYLQRIFKELTGETVWHYLMNLRLGKAANFLESTDIPIGEIDQMVGIHSRQNFYQNFKKNFHMSPREYRKKHAKFYPTCFHEE